MAKVRIIPKLLLKTQVRSSLMTLVTTVGFDKSTEIGDAVSQAKIYEAQAADELLFLHLDNDPTKREALLAIIRQVAEEIFMPFTVGGGVRTVDDFRLLLCNGADKVSINTAAYESPGLIEKAASVFGSQCVVVSIDYRRDSTGRARVFTRNGKHATGLCAKEWALEAEKRGAGELLMTSIDRDGSRSGLDVDLLADISDAVSIPVIGSGGCGTAQHFVDGFKGSRVAAISAGTFFCFKDQNPMQTRARILNAGIPIRIAT